jgi:hypothetical protein
MTRVIVDIVTVRVALGTIVSLLGGLVAVDITVVDIVVDMLLNTVVLFGKSGGKVPLTKAGFLYTSM